jgi:hypothetical protein
VKENNSFAQWQPFGPYWLRVITENRFWAWGDHLVAADVNYSNQLSRIPGKRNIKVLRVMIADPTAMQCLQHFPNLLAIDLNWGGCDCTDVEDDVAPFWPCLRVISQCKALQGLNLYNTYLTNRDLKELCGMHNLRNLELSVNSEINDEGLVHLKSLRSLRQLGLRGTSVTAKGVETLQRALPLCEIEWDDPKPGRIFRQHRTPAEWISDCMVPDHEEYSGGRKAR